MNKNSEAVLGKVRASLTSSKNFSQDDPMANIYSRGVKWLENFIMQPNKGIGRLGPVCPFVRAAHEKGEIYFSYIDVKDIEFYEYVSVIFSLVGMFDEMRATYSHKKLLSIIIYVTNIDARDYYRYIDLAHALAKPLFMSMGQMIGEFRPRSSVGSVRASEFRPMVSPVPCFVIRSITEHDILFIDKDTASVETRLHELVCYRDAMVDELSHLKRESLETRIHSLECALGQLK